MVNYIRKEISVGGLKAPVYTPYIAPNPSESPWPAPSADRRADLAMWNSNRQASRAENPQSLPLNAWLLYQMRFILSTDLCGDWATFGGLSAQLDHLSISLRLSTTEDIGAALTYGQLSKAHLEELARANGTAGVVDFDELLPTKQHCFKMQAAHQHVKPVKDPPVKKEKEKKTWRANPIGFLIRNT